MPTLQEAIVASREDVTHESPYQVANLELSQGRRPSSQPPSREVVGGSHIVVLHGAVVPVQWAVVHLDNTFLPLPGEFWRFRKCFP